MPTELTQEELAAVEAGRKARGVTVPAVEAYKEEISHTEQPKGLDAINISSDGIVETTPVAAASEEVKTTPTNGLKVVPIAEAKSQDVKLDNKIDPNVAPSADSIYLANSFNDYVNSIYGEDQRIADEKKKKAAKWITAAQMLGDSIGALGNVYWAGKGANAQKFEPGAPKAAAATYQMEQDIRNAREKAAKAKLDATLKMHELKMQEKQQNIDNIIKFGNLEINKAKMLSDANYQKQMLDLRAKELIQNGVKADQAFKISMEELGIKRDNLKLDKKELDARIDGSYYSKYGSGSGTPKPVWTPWGNAAINESMLGATNLVQLVDMAGKEDADEISALIAALDDDKPETVNALKQKIGRMLADASNEKLYKRMKQQGILIDYGVNATTGSDSTRAEGGNDGRTVVDY